MIRYRVSNGRRLERDIAALTEMLADAIGPMERAPWLVTSVIHPVDKPLSYSRVRSVFSPEERLEQTLSTVRSIFEFVPAPRVILCDASAVNEREVGALREAGANVVVARHLAGLTKTIDGPFKGLGEAALLSALAQTAQATEFGFWKMSGRYAFNRRFEGEMNPRGLAAAVSGGLVSTICFGVQGLYAGALGEFLSNSHGRLLSGESLEQCVTDFAEEHGILRPQTMGVQGQVAVDHCPIEI